MRDLDTRGGGRQAAGADLTRPLPPEPRPNIGLLLDRANEEIATAIHAHLADAGFGDIRPAHGKVFESVSGEGSRLTDMASRAMLTKQAMQYLVDDLERLGYAERFAMSGDRRAKLVRLTPKGRRAVLVARDAIAAVEAEWEQRLGPRRARELRRALEDLTGARGR